MTSEFFKIKPRSIISGDWGDYGDILQHGMTAHSARVDGRLALERTGPYIPPVTLPGLGDIVLTDGARKLLESSGLNGFKVRPIEKKLIVELHWDTWDLNAEEPAEYPDSGEPEDYILGQQHSPNAAMALGELWELVVDFNVKISRPTPIVSSYKELHIDLQTWDGSDLLRGKEYGGMLFSRRARDWFSEQWGQYVSFDPFLAA